MRILKSLTILGIVLFITQCATVPITGRKQAKLMPNSQIFPSSFEQYAQVKKEGTIITGTSDAQMVTRVGQKIQKAVEGYFKDQGDLDYLKDYRWEYILLKDDQMVNAWCMPGGKVAFYTGIIPICKDETGLAVVMGHEIAHAIANHGRERVSQQMAASTVLQGAGAAMGTEVGGISSEIILKAAGAGTSVGMLKFSRTHESEADEMGLYFMAMAGYDPQQAPKFWERMSAGGGGGSPEFLSTHPSHDTRISDLNANMAKALEYYKASK
ncbi:MAG: M48 family metallopeptidase [Cyclobacteriaceae bacterium]